MPPQQPDDIRAKVEKFLNEEFAKLNTKCSMKIEYLHGGIPWVADHKHWNYQAAKNATEVRSWFPSLRSVWLRHLDVFSFITGLLGHGFLHCIQWPFNAPVL